MKPDDIVARLDIWGLKTTRRTVLTYEKQMLIPPPYLETGKMKEYPETAIAEFIASWCLIHGDYGLKPEKVAEVRKRALQIIYCFQHVWKEELPNLNDIETINQLVKNGLSWNKPSDFFVFSWIMTRMAVSSATDPSPGESVKEFIRTGNFQHVPRLRIRTDYLLSSERIEHRAVAAESSWVEDRGSISVNLIDIESPYISPRDVADALDCGMTNLSAGHQGTISIKYFHPEDYLIRKPVIQ